MHEKLLIAFDLGRFAEKLFLRSDLPRTFKVQGSLWSELSAAEERARATLRLGDLYTDLETQVACSTALSSVVNVVASQWVDISSEPEIAWIELQSKVISTGSLRLKIQESQKRVLELDGYVASVFPKYGRWKTIRRIKRMQKALSKLST